MRRSTQRIFAVNFGVEFVICSQISQFTPKLLPFIAKNIAVHCEICSIFRPLLKKGAKISQFTAKFMLLQAVFLPRCFQIFSKIIKKKYRNVKEKICEVDSKAICSHFFRSCKCCGSVTFCKYQQLLQSLIKQEMLKNVLLVLLITLCKHSDEVFNLVLNYSVSEATQVYLYVDTRNQSLLNSGLCTCVRESIVMENN